MNFFDQLIDGFEDLGRSVADWAPRILVAILILIIGRWIARFVRKLVRKLLEKPATQSVYDSSGLTGLLQGSDQTPASLVSSLIYAFMMVIVFLIVAQQLMLTSIERLLQDLIAFLPLVVVAVAIVIIASAIASFMAGLVKPFADNNNVPWLTTVVRVGILVFGIVTALDVVHIGFFTNTLFSIVLGGASIAFAVAFGVGGIDTAKKWWEKYLSPSD